VRLFVDSWGWLSLEDGQEQFHQAAKRCYGERRGKPGRIVTSDFVLDETITHLFRHRPFDEAWRYLEGVLESAAIGFVSIEHVTEARFLQALEMRRRFRDKPGISFTDLTSMVILRELRITDVLTADRHFQQVGLGFKIFPG
jgi:predicted nucleic acid-binding protein